MRTRVGFFLLATFLIFSYVAAGGSITHVTGTAEAAEGVDTWGIDDPHKSSAPSHIPGTFYQQDGQLCIDGVCYESEHQKIILENELYKRHECQDLRTWCKDRAGECDSNGFLHAYCPRTCRVCHNRTRTFQDIESDSTTPSAISDNIQNASSTTEQQPLISDNNQQPLQKLKRRVKRKEQPLRETWGRRIVDGIGSDLGVPQIVIGAPAWEIHRVVEDARNYVRNTVMLDDQYLTVRDKCINRDERCAMWAAQGKCQDQEFFDLHMWDVCAPVCGTCEQLHYMAQCPIDQNIKHTWYPGDLNGMFERIVNHPDYRHNNNLTVLSRPDYADGDDAETADYQIGPWVIMMDNFATPEEASKLIEVGGVLGYERSADIGNEDAQGNFGSDVNSGRTSTNAWCSEAQCESEPLVDNVVKKMENLTGISRRFSEHLQLLRYEKGQFYQSHHDYSAVDRMRCVGVRILTVFLYLNDVEEGGETNFPELGLSIKPKLGRVALWPSVLNDQPHYKDARTNHQSMPVLKGVKYGANAWYRQRMYRACFDLGC